MPATVTRSVDQQTAEFVGQFYADPMGFVLACYPWGKAGTILAKETGPDIWQAEHLAWIGDQVSKHRFNGTSPVEAIRSTVSSGHGIGKSVDVAWIVNWIMSTRPMAQGSVTANTFTQLQTKTWASIQRWTRLCLTSPWFVINSDQIYHRDFKDSWFCALQSSAKENSEAFAGQHAKNSTSFYVMDEASAIADEIFDVAEGGLTDGEPMIFLFGNPTRSTGKFHRATFGSERNRWHSVIVDSRTSRFTNKETIAEWVQTYGEDSDFVRVRVRGLPPAASDLQFIDQNRVSTAQTRELFGVFDDDPLVCGLDVARGGSDRCVFRFRRGIDGRTFAPIVVPGEQARDSMRLVTLAADILGRTHQGYRVTTLFIDGTGVGGPIADRLRQLGHKNVIEVQFGAESPDPKLANMRAFMWSQMKDWLTRGCIPADARLESDLIGPGYSHDKRDRLVLEAKEHMKARGVDSPDDGDALALTFAAPVVRKRPVARGVSQPTSAHGWMS
jgi:hypothetical protein